MRGVDRVFVSARILKMKEIACKVGENEENIAYGEVLEEEAEQEDDAWKDDDTSVKVNQCSQPFPVQVDLTLIWIL